MKKFFFMSIMVLMTALTFTSCGSDDNKKDEPEQPKDKTVKYVMTAQFDQALLDICDITANYKDASGKNAQEKVTSTTWTKTINPTSLPIQMGVNFVYTAKEDKLTQDKYSFSAVLTHVGQAFGGTPRQSSETLMMCSGQTKERIIELFNKRSQYTYGMYIDTDGTITEKAPTF